MMLRLQNERMNGDFIPSPREYHYLYGLTKERLAKAKPDALVMHPGPMNRGVEIDSEVTDNLETISYYRASGNGGRRKDGLSGYSYQTIARCGGLVMSNLFINAQLILPESGYASIRLCSCRMETQSPK